MRSGNGDGRSGLDGGRSCFDERVEKNGVRAVVIAFGVLAGLLWTAQASALPVYFDGNGGLGFDNSLYGLGIDRATGAAEWRDAADRSFNGAGGADPQFLVLLDTTAEWCPAEVAAQCTDDFSIVDVSYAIELNANVASSPVDLIVILASVNADPPYTPSEIGIEFDAGTSDLQVIQYTPTGATFLGLVLENVAPGPSLEPPLLNFRYRIDRALLENSGGEIALPGIDVAAFAVPEPSVALLLASGLAALSWRRRRRC